MEKVKQHLCIHIRDKPYHCNVCRKQISRKCSLVSRFSMHSGNKIKHDKVHVNHFSLTMFIKTYSHPYGRKLLRFFDGRKLQNLRRNVQGGFCWLASYKREEGRIVGCVKLQRLVFGGAIITKHGAKRPRKSRQLWISMLIMDIHDSIVDIHIWIWISRIHNNCRYP